MAKKDTKTRVTALDRRIGQNLQQLRIYKNVSQTQIAAVLGVSFQQVQKYENGINRLSAGKLYRLQQYFGVPFACFFTDWEKAGDGAMPFSETAPRDPDSFALQIVRSVESVADPVLKSKIAQIVHILAS